MIGVKSSLGLTNGCWCVAIWISTNHVRAVSFDNSENDSQAMAGVRADLAIRDTGSRAVINLHTIRIIR